MLNQSVIYERDKALGRILGAGIVAGLVILVIGLPCLYVWQQRMKSAAKAEALSSELRMLEAQIQTGLSKNDFLAQAARVRAAHLAAQEVLGKAQEAQYGKLDSCLKACPDFWDNGPYWQISTVVLRDSILPPLVAKFGLSNPDPMDLHGDLEQLLRDITQDIDAIMNNQPCPWPK